MGATTHWEETIPFLWSDDLVKGLSTLFRDLRVSKVLDCACGTGFPAIDLVSKGFNVVASDGDNEMVTRCVDNAILKRVNLRVCKAKWAELSIVFDEKFDLVMVRGNSLIYAGSWLLEKGNFDACVADKELKKSLKGIYAVVKPGGYFYVDITNVYEKEGFEDFGSVEKEGVVKGLTFVISYCAGKKHRRIVSKLSSDGVADKRVYNSYLLPHARLVQLLYEVGFTSVDRYVPVLGEEVYSVFIAKKE